MELKIGKSRGRDYLSIVSRFWDRESKTARTRTIQSLGYLDDLKKLYNDPLAHFRQVVAEMNDKAAKEKIAAHIVLDASARVVEADVRKNLGYLALSQIYHELGLQTFFSNHSRKFNSRFSTNNIVKLLVFSRILSPGSKKATYLARHRYFENMDFSLEDVYHCLSEMSTMAESLQLHLHKKISQQYRRSGELVYYDVTNYYFEIDKADEMRKKGYSKEHRPNPIVQMGLFIDPAGIPISYRLFPGNTNDCETLIPILDDMRKSYGISRAIVVADKGINTAGNIASSSRDDCGYVFSQSVRGASRELKDYVLSQSGYREKGEHFKIKSRIYNRYISVTDSKGSKTKVSVEEKQVAVYSSKYDRKAKRDRESIIAKACDMVANPAKYNRATSYGAAKYVKDLAFDKTTGEIIHAESKAVLDWAKISEEEKLDGYYVIITSELNKSDDEILEIYHGLWKIEKIFRVTKTDLETRPVYLSRQDRIEAHFLMCFLALTLAQILAIRLDNEYSISQIANSLNNASCSHVAENWYLCDHSDEVTSALRERMGIDLERKFISLGEIRKLAARVKRSSVPQ